MIGNPEQRLRAFATKQEAAIAALSPAEQKIVKKSGFATRPQVIRPGTSFAKYTSVGEPTTLLAVALREKEGFKTTRTGVVMRGRGLAGLGHLTGAQGTELARHEVQHQVLAPKNLTFEQEHKIIEKGKPLKKIGVTPRTELTPATQGFQTPHLSAVATTGNRSQRRKARSLMRKLGRRVKSKKRGIDF
ncbi:hypothetical protein LCGC14_2590960 [marine sediment metagenome]|uniref:Uncharacterized protein n=1 Tax=marine sediment metagenome TaxID=412755 RepID=A0A0F9ABL6_9ZZZZ